MMLKRFLKGTLKHFGLIAFKRSSRVYIPEDEAYRIVSSLTGRTDPLIIGGGAHLGDMMKRLGASLPRAKFNTMLGSDEARTGEFMPPVISIGMGENFLIRELAEIG